MCILKSVDMGVIEETHLCRTSKSILYIMICEFLSRVKK